jgi:hypothetical protein
MALTAEQVAKAFHDAYEQLAPKHGYKTRDETAVPWADVPEKNKALMIETAGIVLDTLLKAAGATPLTPEQRARARAAAALDSEAFR